MSEQHSYRRFMGKAEFDKAVNSLLGIIEGITIDSKINVQEVQFLQTWVSSHSIRVDKHPFNELIPAVESAIADGNLTGDEKEDLVWLCERLTSSEYYNGATTHMQKLHAILAAIGSDGLITEEELRGLSNWLTDHDHLKTCWPYDEVESLVTAVLADGKIDPNEHNMLMSFFGEFVSILDNRTIVSPITLEGSNIVGVCSVCPEIHFSDGVFCLTGASSKYPRKEFEKLISDLGGKAVRNISKKVNYLVVGSEGNPCWAYSCYGRKVEEAVKLRKEGCRITIVHENDLHDEFANL